MKSPYEDAAISKADFIQAVQDLLKMVLKVRNYKNHLDKSHKGRFFTVYKFLVNS